MTHLLIAGLFLLGPTEFPPGTAQLEIVAGGKSIEVFTYKPDGYRDGPLILVFHGVLRNAADYRNHAKTLGDRLGALIAAPRFDLERFPVESYQQGGVLISGKPASEADWTFRRIPELADEIRRRAGRPDMPYMLLGHSGGGQFLVRLAGFVETDALRIVAANPGTHLWPTRKQPYPYGFGGLPDDWSDDRAIRRYLAQPLTIYLGTNDTLADEHFDQRPEASLQGTSRLERGRNVFDFARKLADERGWAFRWRLIEAPHIPHDHERMFNHPQCSEALYGLNPMRIVGHRGLLQEAPENTRAAFRTCLDLRIGFEVDVRRTADGQLVCLHDETLDRTTDGIGKVTEATLESLRRLDAGRWFAPEFAGERIPTVDEVFALLADHRDKQVLVAVDVKATDAQVENDLVQLARRHDVLERLMFIGRTIDHADVRERFKASDARARVARLVPTAAELPAAVDETQADWIYLRFIPSAADVRGAILAGKRIFLVGSLVAGREPENWKAAVKVGVDGILTDHPLDLRRALLEDRVRGAE